MPTAAAGSPPPSGQPPRSALAYRPDIDGLRAVAVLAVIAFHAFPGVAPGGFYGVDIFFVISGYLISTLLAAAFARPGARPGPVIADFYRRRVRRILPSLLVVLAACYAFGYARLIPGAFGQLAEHVAASAGFCLNLVLAASTGYFDTEAASKPLLHLWSLGVEEQFYLAWPLVIWFVTRARLGLLRTAVFLAAVSYFINVYKPPGSYAADFFLPQTRFWELSVGCIAAALDPALRRTRAAGGERRGLLVSNLAALVGAVLAGLALFLGRDRAGVPDAQALLPTGAAFLLILAGPAAWLNRRLLAFGPLVAVGLVSYPLYLWHWPLLSFARITLGDADTAAVRLVLIAAGGLLAVLTYVLVEVPIRRRRPGGRLVAALLVALALVGTVGWATYRERGFPGRFPPLLRELADFRYDYGKDWREGTYFMDRGFDASDFRRDPGEVAPGRPTIFLWGDSHAAALYPGYRATFGRDFNIVQRTGASMPPLLETEVAEQPGAPAFNRAILAMVRQIRPDEVVLAANWVAYDWRKLGGTVAALRELGIHRILVVGPDVQWVGGLPQQVFNYYSSHPTDPLPFRLKAGASRAPGVVDAQMGPFCRGLGIAYISIYSLLSGPDGFLIRTGETADSLVTYDGAHLTQAGSEYLVARFPRE